MLEELPPRTPAVPPDIVACPPSDEASSSKFIVWYNETLLDALGVSLKDLDPLIETIFTSGEDSPIPSSLMQLAQQLEVHNAGRLLRKFWNTRVYEPERGNQSAGKNDKMCEWFQFYGSYLPYCIEAKLAWVLKNSLCLVWDMGDFHTGINFYIYLSKFGDKPSLMSRWWVGNLDLDKIENWHSFTEPLTTVKVLDSSYYYENPMKREMSVCQTEMQYRVSQKFVNRKKLLLLGPQSS